MVCSGYFGNPFFKLFRILLCNATSSSGYSGGRSLSSRAVSAAANDGTGGLVEGDLTLAGAFSLFDVVESWLEGPAGGEAI